MKVIGMIKKIKEIHPVDIQLVKIGTFYHAYGRDAYILSYLFKYNIKWVENDIPTVGFPVGALNSVISKLESSKINYMLLDRRNNYEVDFELRNGNLNQYNEIYEKAKIYVNILKRIQNINEFLVGNIKAENIKEIIKDIEKVIDENRKV